MVPFQSENVADANIVFIFALQHEHVEAFECSGAPDADGTICRSTEEPIAVGCKLQSQDRRSVTGQLTHRQVGVGIKGMDGL